ncbi:MAG: DNA polymerase III subunit epsilon [Halobacteriovoraceae bacterium]|jgi:DNA polymerase III subunit epsilon|nr:DNA polymerase III subunit epsilon [Halobacteriovoraceae bacterium]
MKKFFVDNIYNADQSITIKEFTKLPEDLFSKEIEMSSEFGICSILDTETTGLDHKKDEIIEIAIRKWVYHKKDHYLVKPIEEYSQLNEPVNNEISTIITGITGITKEDVKGKKIDWNKVAQLIAESDFILAHNAAFDRPMIEAIPQIKEISASKFWTCSFKQVDWASKGFISSKQELLSIFHGFHYSGHRALTDVDALANLLMQGDYLKEILANAKVKQVSVNCVKAPFDAKDLLKSKSFFWNAPKKFWSKLVAENELEEITSFLTSEVYPKGRMTAEFDTIELRDRFKA